MTNSSHPEKSNLTVQIVKLNILVNMDLSKKSLALHKKLHGKFATAEKIKKLTPANLALIYTPGVAVVSSFLAANKKETRNYTMKRNSVAVVSDGSAVLGLGNIGPEGALPVMEGKALLFKNLADIDAVPIVLNTQDTEEIIKTIKNISPAFGGINLEDIAAPRCFEIEARLAAELDIPVFHDDQRGTAVVVLAGLLNALKVVKKKIETAAIVINGVGAAGTAIAKLLHFAGAQNIVMVDSEGIVAASRANLPEHKKELLTFTNKNNIPGNLQTALAGADVFIGVSKGNLLNRADIRLMNKNSIVFAMANPTPEIMPPEAKKGGSMVVATGRSDFANQINNVLVFPGLFRGLLDSGKKIVTAAMQVAAAEALARLIKKLTAINIIPSVFDPRVVKVVARAIKNN